MNFLLNLLPARKARLAALVKEDRELSEKIRLTQKEIAEINAEILRRRAEMKAKHEAWKKEWRSGWAA